MKNTRKIHFNSVIDILMYTGQGSPFSARLRVGKIVNAALLLAGFCFVSFTGTLLFFREYDINRDLEEQLVLLKNEQKLPSTKPRPTATETAAVAVTIPKAPVAPVATVAPTTPVVAAPVQNEAPTRELLSQTKPSTTRIDELAVECASGTCNARVAMAATGSTVAQGALLLVLETEVPRIGAGSPNAQIRKRYFIYPSNEGRDELDVAKLATLPNRPFKFAKFLQTNVQFQFGKLLRPLALNIYIFDRDQTLVQHERRAIEIE